VPFDLNTNQFHFDTEIIIQLLLAGCRIVERPIPTYYGDEICRVDGLAYARDVMRAVVRARAQALGLFYDARFDCVSSDRPNAHYEVKLDFDSPHTFALRSIPAGSRVLDLGCAGGRLAAAIRQNGNYVAGVDVAPLAPGVVLDEFEQHDLNLGPPAMIARGFDVILLLDVIEHLAQPEVFARRLRELSGVRPETRIIASTGNIGFIIPRLMLFAGQFNYGKRGILDLTHTRLFTFSSLRRLFEQHGFRVLETRGVPGPFPLATSPRLGRWLVALNQLLIRCSKRLFSYQMVMVLQPSPSLDVLLKRAEQQAITKAAAS
jgi:2-polyprenyl-3-methyl-5-hydroxy-6-metoxy-1,4-benzoquinol methylase